MIKISILLIFNLIIFFSLLMIQLGDERPTEFVAVSTLIHVILHAGLAQSCRIHISKSEGKPSPWEEGTRQGG